MKASKTMTNKEYYRKYYSEHKEQYRIYNKRYSDTENGRKKRYEAAKRWNERNPNYNKENSRRWREKCKNTK